jgi:hypothetical protein
MRRLLLVGVMAGALVWQTATYTHAGRLTIVNTMDGKAQVSCSTLNQGNSNTIIRILQSNDVQIIDVGDAAIGRIEVSEWHFFLKGFFLVPWGSNDWKTICEWTPAQQVLPRRNFKVFVKRDGTCTFTEE